MVRLVVCSLESVILLILTGNATRGASLRWLEAAPIMFPLSFPRGGKPGVAGRDVPIGPDRKPLLVVPAKAGPRVISGEV